RPLRRSKLATPQAAAAYTSQYFFAPAAVSSARLTATSTSLTLYPFWLSGLAPWAAACPAFAADSSVIDCPSTALAASSATIGVGATWPRTIFTPVAFPSLGVNAQAACTKGQSYDCLCLTS